MFGRSYLGNTNTTTLYTLSKRYQAPNGTLPISCCVSTIPEAIHGMDFCGLQMVCGSLATVHLEGFTLHVRSCRGTPALGVVPAIFILLDLQG